MFHFTHERKERKKERKCLEDTVEEVVVAEEAGVEVIIKETIIEVVIKEEVVEVNTHNMQVDQPPMLDYVLVRRLQRRVLATTITASLHT